MTNPGKTPIDALQLRSILESIQLARSKISWKPGKAGPHLAKRIRLGHLPEDATLEKYEKILAGVLNNAGAELYLFVYGRSIYPTISALVEGKVWLVMLGLDGVLETGFPPEEPESYLADNSFIYLGLVKELEA